ncbi:MAG: hydroxymethylpyrimidine/phosphomethylpyrimidine kinase [Flavobacteriales bacterium]|nr:hydroxymethylpyrimidine/phosphomethylpyrimidine kinase [Flavobacteriales bacterium]
MKSRPKILTIAGFDPSGGAGILADVKTIEANKCAAFAVCTANTIQNETEFISANWIAEDEVFAQLDILLKEHQLEFVKIGLVPSLQFVKTVISTLKNHHSSPKIVWDPILSASAGFNFEHDLSELEEVLKEIYIITPNWNEVKQLSGNEDAQLGAEQLAQFTNVYLKGGHNPVRKGKDYFYFEEKILPFNPKVKVLYEKHGSGCVFSSALTSNLAIGFPIIKACLRSKAYMYKFLNSSPSLLGTHRL